MKLGVRIRNTFGRISALGPRVVGVITFLFGLLYIPAFVYGTFWLWVFPFTALVTLFLRVLIDHAIEKVSAAGDAAKQAKAMIPEFIKMNVIMTVLLSVPFVVALWLSHEGYIQAAVPSELDQELWKLCLWIMRDLDALDQTKYANVQILLSNMFFMIVGTLALLTACFKKIRQLFFVLFHRESYKFLQKKPSSAANLIDFMGIIVIVGYIIAITVQISPSTSFVNSIGSCCYLNFLVTFQVCGIVSTAVIRKIRKENI